MGLGEEIVRHLDRAYALARSVTPGRADAEDAVSAAVAALLSRPGRYDPSRPFFPYFARAVINAAHSQRRAAARRAAREEETVRRPEQPDGAERLERQEAAAVVRAALGRMPEDERAAVLLAHVEGLSMVDLAASLGVSRTTASDRARRGAERLRAALARAGYEGAALGGLLAALPREPAPQALNAAVETMIRGSAAARGAAAKTAAAKGGLAMKAIAGVVLAGVLAGGAALLMPGKHEPASPPAAAAKPPVELAPVGGPLKQEHYTGCNLRVGAPSFGPRLEAAVFGGTVVFDDHWNLWGPTAVLRAADGRIVPIGETDSFNEAPEGPASVLPNLAGSFGYGQNLTSFAVVGLPLEGGDKGSLYYSSADQVLRIYRNPGKEGRWWYTRVMGLGKTPLPGARGQSAPAEGTQLAVRGLQSTKDGKLIVFAGGSFYSYDGKDLTCLLALGDYQAKGPQKTKAGPAGPVPTQGAMDADGKTFYVGYYFAPNFLKEVWRVSDAGARMELYLRDSGGSGGWDGPGRSAGFFCGPHMANGRNDPRFQPPGVLFTSTHDEAGIRRTKDGRIAHLCLDGNWRELPKKPNDARGASKPQDVVNWGRAWNPGPSGTLLQMGTPCSGGPDWRTWIISGVDFAKPTAVKLGGGKP